VRRSPPEDGQPTAPFTQTEIVVGELGPNGEIVRIPEIVTRLRVLTQARSPLDEA
jgi:hypothetical protein